jgi:hypothetical protein
MAVMKGVVVFGALRLGGRARRSVIPWGNFANRPVLAKEIESSESCNELEKPPFTAYQMLQRTKIRR